MDLVSYLASNRQTNMTQFYSPLVIMFVSVMTCRLQTAVLLAPGGQPYMITHPSIWVYCRYIVNFLVSCLCVTPSCVVSFCLASLPFNLVVSHYTLFINIPWPHGRVTGKASLTGRPTKYLLVDNFDLNSSFGHLFGCRFQQNRLAGASRTAGVLKLECQYLGEDAT